MAVKRVSEVGEGAGGACGGRRAGGAGGGKVGAGEKDGQPSCWTGGGWVVARSGPAWCSKCAAEAGTALVLATGEAEPLGSLLPSLSDGLERARGLDVLESVSVWLRASLLRFGLAPLGRRGLSRSQCRLLETQRRHSPARFQPSGHFFLRAL